MKFAKSLIICTVISGFLLLSSCGPCGNADAAISNYDLRFKLVDKTTGDDLIFGPNATLNLEDIQLYSLIKNDTIFYPLTPSRGFESQGEDSELFTEIFPPASDVFLQYPDKTHDLLFLTYSQRETECWGLLTYVTSVTRNQSEFFDLVRDPLIFPR